MTQDAKTVAHSRGSIIAAAQTILSQYGLGDLSMRKLAGQLQIQPSALYWHFENKQKLLAAVADAILAEILSSSSVRVSTSTAERLQRAEFSPVLTMARSIRSGLMRYRDSAEMVSSSVALGLGGDALLEHLERAVADSGVEAQVARASAITLVHYILGFVQHAQTREQAREHGVVVVESAICTETDFDRGIQMLLAGIPREM